MILRRIRAHVEAENWFAVFLDFLIVVVGVFIGVQVANWNDARVSESSGLQYLERLTSDLEATLDEIETRKSAATESMAVIEAFTATLSDDTISDSQLVVATRDYAANGAFTAMFNPVRTTFDDLISTGNIGRIPDEAIRASLVELYADYAEAVVGLEANIDWLQVNEGGIYTEFDFLRYDPRTSSLFGALPVEEQADAIRQHRDLLRRNAAVYYWPKSRAMEFYDDFEPRTQTVLNQIRDMRDAP